MSWPPEELRRQNLKEWLWPDVTTLKGEMTAELHTFLAAWLLVGVYICRLLLPVGGSLLPPGFEKIVTRYLDFLKEMGGNIPEEPAFKEFVIAKVSDWVGWMDSGLNIICLLTAIYYLFALQRRKNPKIPMILAFWLYLEVGFEIFSSPTPMFTVLVITAFFATHGYRLYRQN